MNQMRQVDNRRRLVLAVRCLLLIWPIVCIMHGLVSLISFVLTGEVWNPLALDANRTIAACALGAYCTLFAWSSGPGR